MKTVRMFLSVMSLAFSALAWAGPIDINTADAKTLEQLNGIGPEKAQAIVDYRGKNGPFKVVGDLAKVQGIGPKTLEKLQDQLTVSKVASK